MTTKTKKGAADVLIVVASILAAGRPRKPLGKARPKHQGNKMSLVGALKYAKRELGVTRRQYEAAIDELEEWAWQESPHFFRHHGDTPLQALESYDEMELDTREVCRIIRKAIKKL